MDELLGEFVAETLETLENLSGEVIAWEADPSEQERLSAIFRFFHTVKGSAGFLNLPRFEKLSHAAEDVLAAMRNGTRTPDPATISAVLAAMDRIAELTSAIGSDSPLPDEAEDQPYIRALASAAGVTVHAPILAPVIETASSAAIATPDTTAERETQHQNREQAHRTIRISLGLIDQLMNGVSDMVLARNELARRLRESGLDPEIEGSFERLSACVADIRDMVGKTRMQRVDRLFAAIPRTVRTISQDLAKKVDLQVEGGDVEMDREMIEMVVDPLTHIVRNALDHGIEAPQARIDAGKSEHGNLRIAARQSGNQIVIEIVDDGRGIDTGALVAKATRLGLLNDTDIKNMSQADKINLIFHPGLSTSQEITAISGRGVGMDVVRNNVERIGGVVSIDSVLGVGTTIQLRVPLTLTIIPGLILRCGTELFAMPRGNVVELLHDNNVMVSIDRIGGARIATIRGERYSMIDLEEMLGRPINSDRVGARTLMLIRSASGLPYALGVDAVENHEELVIRPASPLVMAAGIFAGMTLPDSGRPMLLLDAAGIAQVANLPLEIDKIHTAPEKAERGKTSLPKVKALHFVATNGNDRLIALDVVERIEEVDAAQFGSSNTDHFVRLDGQLLPVLNGPAPAGSIVKTLLLRVGRNAACYVVQDVVDIVQMPLRPDLAVNAGGISGIVTIDGAVFEVIDTHDLFAQLDHSVVGTQPENVCYVRGLSSDPWMRAILAPLLVQAGYDIREAMDDDLRQAPSGAVVLCADQDLLPTDVNLPVLRLLSDDAARDGGDIQHRSVYRYDRAGLLAAVDDILKARVA